MPLNPATLSRAVLALTDPDAGGFRGFPADEAQAAANWAGVMRTFFQEMVFPPVQPGIHVAAESAARSALTGLNSGGLATLKQGWVVYAASLVGGVIPPVLALPPPGQPLLALPAPTGNAAQPAALLAAAVFAWSKGGLAGPPPAGPVTPWS